MDNEQNINRSTAISRALIGLTQRETELGLTPDSVLISQVTRSIADRNYRGLKVTDADVAKVVSKGTILEGLRLPFPLEAYVEETGRAERGRLRVKFRPYQIANGSNLAVPLQPETTDLSRAIDIIGQFDLLDEPIDPQAIARVSTSLSQSGCVEFIQFNCPPVDFALLQGTQPESYLLADASKEKNFKRNEGRTLKFVRALQDERLNIRFNIVIGDTDEPEYIFPVIGQPELDPDIVEERRKLYEQSFRDVYESSFPRGSLEVYRWSELSTIYEGPEVVEEERIPQADIDEEVRLMQTLFEPGNYYSGLTPPPNELLKQIVLLKLSTYARQGYLLSRFFPYGVLLQNESPLRLRTKMYNYFNTTDERLPVIYPYRESL